MRIKSISLSVNRIGGLIRRRMPVSPIGFVDQAIVSAVNFGTTVILARSLSIGEFGAFALLFTLLMLFITLQAALITQVHNVLGAAKNEDGFADYTGKVAFLQQALAGAILILWIVVAIIAHWLGWEYSTYMAGFGGVLFAWLAQEFVRRGFFSKGNLQGAIRNDVVSYGLQLILLLILLMLDRLTLGTAVLAIALSSGLAYFLGLRELTGRFHCVSRVPLTELGSTLSDHWQYGRWLLGSSLLAWNAGGWYLVLLMVGEKAAGAWRGIEVLVGPIQLMMAGLDSLLPTRVAQVFAGEGVKGVRRTLLQVYGISIPILLAYCIPVVIFGEKVIRFVLGNQYSEFVWLLMLVVLVSFVGFLQQPLSLALRGIGHTSVIFRGQVSSSVIAMPIGVLTGLSYGVIGAAIGLLLHFVILNVVLWMHWSRVLARLDTVRIESPHPDLVRPGV